MTTNKIADGITNSVQYVVKPEEQDISTYSSNDIDVSPRSNYSFWDDLIAEISNVRQSVISSASGWETGLDGYINSVPEFQNYIDPDA